MIKKKKKFFTDFAIESISHNGAHVLETQIPVGDPINFPHFEGLYTLRNDNKQADKFNNSPFSTPSKMVKGFLESSGTTKIDLTSKKTKIVKTITSSVFHFFADDVCDILYALRLNPKAELIIDVSKVEDKLGQPAWSFLDFFLDCLADHGVEYKLFDMSKFDVIYINDFTVAESIYRSSLSGDLIFEFFKAYVEDKDIKPSRNVYLTRKKVLKADTEKFIASAAKLSVSHDERIDSHEEMENLFSSLGYEIVAPEDFKDFKEQLNFFYSVKTIASITSSGLTNSLFMQPGGTVIEVSTPLVVESPFLANDRRLAIEEVKDGINPLIAQELHMFYKTVAFLKNHTYFSINNSNRSAKEVKDYIYSNDRVLAFLDHNDKTNNL